MPLCFVVMGFGKKTDFESGRTLDLDKTYEAIIKPAAEAAGYRAVRADEVWHSSIIDTVMYEMLFQADLVIADISTANPNAIYELGVRHALRPKSTIVMKEADGKYFFDLNHEAIFSYKHLGEDIGFTEAGRAQKDLLKLIEAVRKDERIDSPVYTYLPHLRHPTFSKEELVQIIDAVEAKQDHISSLVAEAEALMGAGDFLGSLPLLQKAHALRPSEVSFIQRIVLATYKSGSPSVLTSLMDALVVLDRLNPSTSNDPETLGLAGAVHKRLWWEAGDAPQLEKAIGYYRRGFEVKKDYYNGENLANCYDQRAASETNADEVIFSKLSAKKVREGVREILANLIASDDFAERTDKKWILATKSNVEFALGDEIVAAEFEAKFKACEPAQWEIETFEKTRQDLKNASRL